MPEIIHRESCQLPTATASAQEALSHLLDSMQVAASHHATQLGLGLDMLRLKEQSWVLARQHLQLIRALTPKESLLIATWPSGRRGPYAIRDFLVTDDGGNEIIRATTAWLVLNLSTRRPARPDPALPDFSGEAGRALVDDFPPLPALTDPESDTAYTVRGEDIDINHHVNNIVYLERGWDSLPSRFRDGHRLLALEAAFLAEAFAGDTIRCRTQHLKSDAHVVFIQSLLRPADGRELTRLRWRWQPTGGD